ncbi:MAG TPA: hypothetical protein VFT47_04935 [Vicinamibacterales bacterium]|nr:hypothetical protein [Vicinamibacterales bacterium]
MTRRVCLAAAVLSLLAFRSSAAPEALRLELRLGRSEVALGEPIDVAIAFKNIGDSGLFVERTRDLGPDHVNIIARRGTCEYALTPSHATMREEDRRFLLTGLGPRDQLIQSLPVLNSAEALGGTDLFFPAPGVYTVISSFRSEGAPTGLGGVPVWRGVVTSAPVTLTVRAAKPTTLARMRSMLASGSQGDPDLQAVAYFRYVKDQQAARLLARLLSSAAPNPVLMEAVAWQGRRSDAELLERHAREQLSTDRRLAEYARDLATRLRERGPCDQ